MLCKRNDRWLGEKRRPPEACTGRLKKKQDGRCNSTIDTPLHQGLNIISQNCHPMRTKGADVI